MFHTILIDIDNTLLDFDKCAALSMRQGFEELQLPFEDSMFGVFTAVNDSLWAQLEQGQISREALHRRRWGIVFDKLQIDADGEAFEKRFYTLLSQSHEPVDGAHELLKYLSAASYTLCAASNGAYDQQHLRLEKAGMLPYFKHLFISERIGCAKPGRAFFEACFRELGTTDPREILLIGDSPHADIQGGAMAGLCTCWFNPRGAAYDGVFLPDYVITRLDELQHIL